LLIFHLRLCCELKDQQALAVGNFRIEKWSGVVLFVNQLINFDGMS
jgi:hypothetical protein